MCKAIENEVQYQPLASLLALSCVQQKLQETLKELPTESLSKEMSEDLAFIRRDLIAALHKVQVAGCELRIIDVRIGAILAQRAKEASHV